MKYLIILLSITFLASCSQNPKEKLPSLPLANPIDYSPKAVDDTLHVLSWNVEHFVDTFDDPYINNRRENEVDTVQLNAKYALFAQALKLANADIVVLQEFESASFLEVIANDYFPDLGYKHFQGHESNNWYMNVVVMSRIPLGTFFSYSPWTLPIEGFTEDDGSAAVQNLVNNRMWSVEVLPSSSYRFMITGLHLKAGRGERNEAWRLSQIKALRAQFERFEQWNPSLNHLVVGDLNCTPESDEFRYLLTGDSSLNGPLFIDPLAGTEVFSHPADSVFWRIDHILLNKQMMPELLSDSPFGPFTPFSPDSMRSISDHLPMQAYFLMGDK